jgi:uncharacterized protein (DUF1684 family)
MRLSFLVILFFALNSNAQSFEQEVENFRNNYIADHLQEEHSPIKYAQVKNLDFFSPNEKYKVKAKVKFIQDNKGFTMLTHTGKKKQYYKYAQLSFQIENKKQVLFLYQSKRLLQKKEYRDYLFLPFTDASNYAQTFGGGRYIDFVLDDIKDGYLMLDFNKCYNPYCAYAGGFNCPIPPKENRLDIAIQAGEKLYVGNQETSHK